MALTAQQVQQFYIGYYGRPADPVGLAHWQTQDEAAALKGFSESAEFTNQFTGLSAAQQVTKVYGNLLGRAPDTAGLLYWAGELTAGRETIGSLVLSMIKNALGKDVTTIEDRVTYSTAFTTALNTAEEINAYSGQTATQAARDALLKVVATAVGDHTALDAEVKNIDATIATIVAGGGSSSGQTFTLTVGQDYADSSSSFKNGGLITSDFKFTSGNETVTAGAGTLGNTDALVDGSTTDADVLNATLTSGAAATTTIQNIETLNLTATIANSGLDFANVTGAKKVTLTGTANSQLTNVNATAAPAFEINNYNKAVALDVLTLVGTTAAGTAESLTIKASGLTAGGTALAPVIPTLTLTATAAGTLETLNLESAGTAKNTLAVNLGAGANAVAKTVVTGAADLDLMVANAMINGQTLDGAGHTGVLNLIVDRNGATTAVTNLTNVTGADVYTFRDSVAAGDALVASGLASGSTVALTYSTTGASSLAVKGAAAGKADSLTLVLDNAADATNTTVATSLTVTDVETLNIKSEGGTTAGNTINALTVTAGSTVSVDGSTKLTLDLAATSLVSVVEVKGSGAHSVDFAAPATYADGKNLTIDGSAATGKLTLNGVDFTGTAGGSGAIETLTIRGGSSDDTITAHGGANARSIIDAGAGADTVNVATAANVTLGTGADKLNLTGLTGGITVTDFTLGAGGDVLSVATGTAMTFGGVVAATGGADGVTTQLVILNGAAANDAAIIAEIGGLVNAAIIAVNNATGVAELWFSATAGIDEVKLATFENITTVGVLTDATSGFVAANFGTWA